MKAKSLIFVTTALLSSYSVTFSQTRDCATMESLQMQIQQDPQLKQRMDSLELAKQNYIKASGYYEDYSQLNLPVIPGFEPTGNPEIDLKSFSIAKKELYAKDPELYRQLTRIETPTKNKRK